MDRTTELTGNCDALTKDAFVEVKFADLDTMRTPEVIEDSDLQNEPLEIKVLDYDQITYNDSIGMVLIDLNPLLAWDSSGVISGWFPIYDTLFGIRGELNAQVKIQFFGNINPFKDSSAGVQFFSSPVVPPQFQIVSILGFVSAIQNEDDPEYHWVDSFRAPRKSNEARTRVMFRLSGGRMLGKKVLELGGNAILGFKQYFDLESEKKSITVRSIGTAVKLIQANHPVVVQQLSAYSPGVLKPASPSASPEKGTAQEGNGTALKEELLEDELSLPSPVLPITPHPLRPQDPVFLTLNQFPAHCIVSTGGFVCAASIKLLDGDERDPRELWWQEVRDEIKSHARTVACSHVIGYTETTSISDEIVFLYCSGTAVNLDMSVLQIVTNSRSSDELFAKLAIAHRWSSMVQPGSTMSQAMGDDPQEPILASAKKSSLPQLDNQTQMHEEPLEMKPVKKKRLGEVLVC
ncbi:hypothetical protein HDU91_002785 [Kappamyces sp. JEL0680]|nr:hypothetical protein HDU91_002785 [Kappamyces sp. JEL0680]